MSQAPVRPTGPGPATPAVPSGGVPAPSGTSTLDFPTPVPSRTPQLLQRLQVVVALALLVAGMMSAWVIADLRADLAAAPNLAQQYARLGQVQHDLSAAARLAETSVILDENAGGENAKASIEQVVAASGLLVQAAKDRPQDAEALQAIGGGVLRYSLTLASALGASPGKAGPVLVNARDQLDALLGEIDQLQDRLATEAQTRPWSQNTAVVTLTALAMLVVLGWVSWVVARRSHRVLNPGVIAAAIALVVLIGITAAAQLTAESASDSSRSTQFSRVVNTTNAGRHLDAAQLILTTAVLTRTWNNATEADYTAAYKAARSAANAEGLSGLGSFNGAAQPLADHLSAGEWAQAQEALLATGRDSLSGAATTLRESATSVSDSAVAVAAAAPANARANLIAQLVFVIAIALVGAALGVLGLYQRLREYR